MAVARERNIAQLNPIHQWMRLLEDYDLRSFARGVNFSESLVKIAYLAGALLSVCASCLQIFMRNIMRVKNFALVAVEMKQAMQSCFSWESPLKSSIAFIVSL